ncbi:MAG: hypothetical protein HY738_19055 [Bacteroidia bacterium]|nr:hypothetical protein [Bacteroidia bacterium]
MKPKIILILVIFYLVTVITVFSQNVGNSTPSVNGQPVTFSQADRDRIIRMEAILEQHEKRFEQIERRFEQVDRRFEQIDRRFEELRTDMNTRFGWLIALFTTMMIFTIGFALWDRRTMIRPFETKVKKIEIAIEEVKEEKMANKILTALRELAKTDNKLAEVLRTYNLL